MNPAPFHVGIGPDFFAPGGALRFDIGLDLLKQNPAVSYAFAPFSAQATPAEIAPFDAILVAGKTKITRASLEGVDKLVAVAKFGVGHDNIDKKACTDRDVLVFITPEGVARPVAVALLTYLLALSTRIFVKDRLVREGRWNEKAEHMGIGLTRKTLGTIGLGNIAREFFRLAAPLEMTLIGHDPFVSPDAARALGVTLVDLDTLLATSDFVCVNCPLNESTHHLLGARAISLMKPTAFLINTARGEVIDQTALTAALAGKRIAGAALDVFEPEPLPAGDPLTRLDNVILSPHGLAWTDELFYGNGAGAMRRLLQVAKGEIPPDVVNAEVLARPGLQAKLARRAGGEG